MMNSCMDENMSYTILVISISISVLVTHILLRFHGNQTNFYEKLRQAFNTIPHLPYKLETNIWYGLKAVHELMSHMDALCK